MKKLLLLLLLLSPFVVYSQNYDCLQQGANPFYTNGNGYLRSMRIDSVVASGADTFFYPYHTPRGNYFPGDILDSTGGSWLGKKVIKQADGTFLFDDMWQDTVVIKTQANVGDSWIFYRDTSQLSYKATVTGADTMTVLGVLDSVKTITIEADSAGSIYALNPMNGFSLKLSKNSGFVQVFDLYTFPYLTPGNTIRPLYGNDYYLDLIVGNLACGDCYGSPGFFPDTVNSIFRRIPLYNPTMMELYDFSVGEIKEFDQGQYVDNGEASIHDVWLDTILSKTVTPYAVTYTFSERHGTSTTTYYSPYPPTVTTMNEYTPINTITFDTSLLMNLTTLPEEWRATYFYHYFPKPDYSLIKACPDMLCIVDYNNIDYTSRLVEYGTLSDGTGGNYLFIGNNTNIYSVGLGLSGTALSYYDASASYSSGEYSYVSNGDSVCGHYTVPPDLVANVNTPVSQIAIFPNPAHNQINISASGMINRVAISNLLGQTMYDNLYNNSKVQVDISGLPTGVYLMKINDVEVRKFLKE